MEYLKTGRAVISTALTVSFLSLRGRYCSVAMETGGSRPAHMAEQGCEGADWLWHSETPYGCDLYGEKSLHKLLKELCRIPGIAWIRVLYCYPKKSIRN